MINKKDLLKAVEQSKARSAWAKGVQAYAVDLLAEAEFETVATVNDLKQELLNGAKDWQQYSYGGCALIYDCQIAKALCSPSELKKTKDGERNPNSRENWLDVQARALYQAWQLIRTAAQNAK